MLAVYLFFYQWYSYFLFLFHIFFFFLSLIFYCDSLTEGYLIWYLLMPTKLTVNYSVMNLIFFLCVCWREFSFAFAQQCVVQCLLQDNKQLGAKAKYPGFLFLWWMRKIHVCTTQYPRSAEIQINRILNRDWGNKDI